jgi:predicted transcriptional regulator
MLHKFCGLEETLAKTVGGDRRTISKYMHLLRRQGVIEPSRRIPGSSGYIYTVRGMEIQPQTSYK